MAALVVKEHIRRAGLADLVTVSSAGVESWHVGKPADPRTVKVLAERGYPTKHVATQINETHLAADLLLAMDSGHMRALLPLIKDSNKVQMLRSFTSDSSGTLDIPDPYLDNQSEFYKVLEIIESTTPGLLTWLRSQLADSITARSKL